MNRTKIDFGINIEFYLETKGVIIMKTKFIFKVFIALLLCINITSINAQPVRHHKQKRHVQHKKVEYSPHHKYSKMPHWGYKYTAVPKGRYIVKHAGIPYHYSKEVFYKPMGSRYVVVRAPIGVRINALPRNYSRIVIRGKVYYYYYGTYYVKSVQDNQYVTVAPPIGARVDALPQGYKKVYIEDNTYYVFEGVYYKAQIDQFGEIWYEVVG